jgi:putative ABC transport system permease protein
VILQFTVSVMLIICTVVVHSQINYAKDRDTGYKRSGLLMIPKKTDDFNKHAELLATELKNSGAVTEVAESAGQLTEIWSGNGGFTWQGKPLNQDKGFSTLAVSHDFGKTVGWTFLSGRDFNKEMASDSVAFVINESAAKVFGIPNPVGEIVHWKNTAWSVDKDFQIVGVIKDMVMESPFDPVQPAFFMVYGWKSWLNLRINPSLHINEALPKIEQVFKKVIPSVPFAYKFADEEYGLKFKAEERIGSLSSVFSGLAILISCMGLFGLASYMAEQRTKELGIRKVLGASIPQLWKLLSLDFLGLVLIACFIALPLSYYLMDNWLQQYQYRTTLSWEVFLIVMLGAITITVLTVSYQAVKAAMSNPVNSLRSE